MTYEDLIAYCMRACSISSTQTLNAHDCVMSLRYLPPADRAIAAETLARFMAEFIEYSRPQKRVH